MKLYNTQISAIVLAGERPERHSADEKFGPFTPVGGKCAIDYVLETIQGSNIINNVIVVADKSKEQLILNNVKEKKKIKIIEPEVGPSLSAYKAFDHLNTPCLLTSGDHPLLKQKTVEFFFKKSQEEEIDLTIGLVPHKLLLDNNIIGKRTLYKFRDGHFCGANLFFFKTSKARKILHLWNKIEGARKKPWKIINYFGIIYLITYLLGLLSSVDAQNHLSRKAGLRIKFIKLNCFEAAIDLDSSKDYSLIKKLIRGDLK